MDSKNYKEAINYVFKFVVDNYPDRDGKDILIDVESGKFVDRIVSFSNNNIY